MSEIASASSIAAAYRLGATCERFDFARGFSPNTCSPCMVFDTSPSRSRNEIGVYVNFGVAPWYVVGASGKRLQASSMAGVVSSEFAWALIVTEVHRESVQIDRHNERVIPNLQVVLLLPLLLHPRSSLS